MSFILDGTTIRSPHNLDELTEDLYAQQISLANHRSRDYMGDTKRTWALDYMNTKTADYTTIKAIWDSYKSTATGKTFESTEANYTIASTTVHIDMVRRSFTVGGTSYISDFTLILTEV